MQQETQFEQWAVIELMGRQKIAGMVIERTIAGAGFLQVNVPATTKNPEFTRHISPTAIYAINPVTEEVARWQAERINEAPINSWDIQEFMRRAEQKSLGAAKAQDVEEELSDDDWTEDHD